MRIFDIITTELAADKLKAEEELERVINNKNLETEDKVATVKQLLKDVAVIELSFEKFKDYKGDDSETNKE